MPRAAALLGAALGGGAALLVRERRRAAAAVEATRAQVTAQLTPPAVPSPEEHREAAFVDALVARADRGGHSPRTVVTDLLWARLTDEDHAALADAMDEPLRELWAGAGDAGRRRLALTLTAHFQHVDALARTGLRADMPPEDVHAMARGHLAAGGDPFLADLVVEALEDAGGTLAEGATVLDFGASSGRVLRVLAAARPDLRCLGCDPNAVAIAWASEHLPEAEFFVSPQAPPLALDAASVDLAYAISIWSHFAAEPALAWLDEMARVVRPGGSLVLTVHALDTLGTGLRRDEVSRGTAAAAAAGILSCGHHFVDVFGEAGDWGVKDPGWGNAYMGIDWLAGHALRDWRLTGYRPAAVDSSQDVVVLERR
jgi:SAM-dependent methyltransferase